MPWAPASSRTRTGNLSAPSYRTSSPTSSTEADAGFSLSSSRAMHLSSDDCQPSSATILPPPNGFGLLGTRALKSEYPGCNALPFQTQYLLKYDLSPLRSAKSLTCTSSHSDIHRRDRPHFCPRAGCPRAIGGKRFKRKNEMIRHALVHRSPGYVCPFCPDREHKHPRPDNLQR